MGVLLRLAIINIQQNLDNFYNCHEGGKEAQLARELLVRG